MTQSSRPVLIISSSHHVSSDAPHFLFQSTTLAIACMMHHQSSASYHSSSKHYPLWTQDLLLHAWKYVVSQSCHILSPTEIATHTSSKIQGRNTHSASHTPQCRKLHCVSLCPSIARVHLLLRKANVAHYTFLTLVTKISLKCI